MFDKIIDRKNTDCEKWDMPIQKYQCEEMIPMWVADMDFAVAKPIQDAIINRAMHPIYGYPRQSNKYREAFANHFNQYCNHQITSDEVVLSTGVVYSINELVTLFTKEQDEVMIHSPAYPPFRSVVKNNRRVVIDTPMNIIGGEYVLDFEAMEQQITSKCKLFILCNPHNPTGKIFTKEELQQVANFCRKHKLFIISDEIHADFIYDQKQFIPIVDIDDYTKSHTITCVSCTKSFNLAGLNVSAVFIKERSLYLRINAYFAQSGLQSINIFGLEAMLAAYTKATPWLMQAVAYLQINRDEACQYLQKHLPKIKFIKPVSTYLLWLDLSAYQLDSIQDTLAKDCFVFVNDGATFGKQYKDFIRINLACPKQQLMKALKSINKFLNSIE